MKKLFCKVKNQVRDAHHRIIKLHYERYDTMLLPDYRSSEMVQTGKRKIQSETAREMLTWSYCKFKQTMQAKAKWNMTCCHILESFVVKSQTKTK